MQSGRAPPGVATGLDPAHLPVWSAGLRGQGQVIGMGDSGVGETLRSLLALQQPRRLVWPRPARLMAVGSGSPPVLGLPYGRWQRCRSMQRSCLLRAA